MKIYCTRDHKSITSYVDKNVWVRAMRSGYGRVEYYLRVKEVDGDTLVYDQANALMIDHPADSMMYRCPPSRIAIDYDQRRPVSCWEVVTPVDILSEKELEDHLAECDQYFYDYQDTSEDNG